MAAPGARKAPRAASHGHTLPPSRAALRRDSQPQEEYMRDLLQFDSMVTPKIITFIYWVLLAASAIGGLVLLGKGLGVMKYSGFAGFGMIVAAPILVVVLALLARIYCEIMIVLFKINEALQDIRRK